jgi:hypothetical protein
MQKNFEGVRVDAVRHLPARQQQRRGQGFVLAPQRASQRRKFFALPKHNVRDGEAVEVTLIIGVNSPGR